VGGGGWGGGGGGVVWGEFGGVFCFGVGGVEILSPPPRGTLARVGLPPPPWYPSVFLSVFRVV